jgi:hypothetical protein
LVFSFEKRQIIGSLGWPATAGPAEALAGHIQINSGSNTNPRKKEGIKMENMTKTLREIALPFVVQMILVAGFLAGWVYLWIR